MRALPILTTFFLGTIALVLGGCGDNPAAEGGLTGVVRVDGSSTVFPISEAVAEEFRTEAPGVRVTVGVSGTGGGMKKFALGEIDIADASRLMKPKEEEKAQGLGIGAIEIPVAFDGLAVVVNPKNTFVDHLTVDELKRIWQPDSTVRTWKDVRLTWPDRPIRLYGPGTDSGTFEYFTKAINGKARASRSDFTASEDDNILVQGVAGDVDGMAYFGFAYWVENQSRLRLVPVDGGKGPILASRETINNGTYAPLSRPIFIYVSTKAAERPEVDAFVHFYLKHAGALAADVGYVALPEDAYDLARRRYDARITGSVFRGRGPGASIQDTLSNGL